MPITSHGLPEPIQLRDVQPRRGEPMALKPLILSREDVVLYGDGGSAKSYLGLAASVSISAGLPILGIEPNQRLRVALLDWEADGVTHLERMQALLPDVQPADFPDLLYVPCGGVPLANQVDRLRDIIERHQIEFVMSDSVAFACDGPPEDAAVAMRFFNALKRLQVGSLLIAHVNRSGDTSKPFGSTFFHNSPRMTWHSRKVYEDENRVDVRLTNSKPYSGGAKTKPMGFRIEGFQDRRVAISPIGVATDDREPVGESTTLKARIVEVLRGGALTYEELAERLDAPINTVRRTVARHASVFVVLKNQRPHRLALVSDQTNPTPKRTVKEDSNGTAISLSSRKKRTKGQDRGFSRTPVCPVVLPAEDEVVKNDPVPVPEVPTEDGLDEPESQPPAIFTVLNANPIERPLPDEEPPEYVLADPVLLANWKRRYPGWPSVKAS